MFNLPTPLRDRPVFICGHPKSGTSLLRSLLDSHPQLVVYPEESGFFRRYLPASHGLSLEAKLTLANERLIHIFTWNSTNPPPSQAGFPGRDYSHISFEAVQQAMRQSLAAQGCRHDGDLLSAAVLAYGQVSGHLTEATCRWVEKTQYDERYAGQIFAWWPQARCIHIVRDPRDNFVSYHRKHPEWSAEVFAWSWVNSTQMGMQNVARYGALRYWLLRYEDLAQQPAETLRELCHFLEIEDHPSLHAPTRGGAAWQGNSMFAERFDEISSAPLDRWKVELPAEEAGVIAALARPEMKRLGYAIQPIAARSRLRALSWRARRWSAALRGRGKPRKIR
jgi:hypothetical protein